MLVLDHSHNNGVAEVVVGDPFRVQLAENPTTGYRWHLQPIDSQAVRVSEDTFETPQTAYGSGGIRRWTFLADDPAVVTLRINLKRSWQPQAAQTFEVTVRIKAR
jgi:inhibitor of cysteine peptidase